MSKYNIILFLYSQLHKLCQHGLEKHVHVKPEKDMFSTEVCASFYLWQRKVWTYGRVFQIEQYIKRVSIEYSKQCHAFAQNYNQHYAKCISIEIPKTQSF